MKYLLDTHALIWTLVKPEQLSKKVRKLLEDSDNTILISALSLWEISLKFSLGKLDLKGISPESVLALALETGFDVIPLSPEQASAYHKISSNWHRDPFDRMLIWQAVQENVILISKDENISKYSDMGLRVIW